LAFTGDSSAVPATWESCLDFITIVFEQRDWQTELAKAKALLEVVAVNEL
jgi:hypothetical protein